MFLQNVSEFLPDYSVTSQKVILFILSEMFNVSQNVQTLTFFFHIILHVLSETFFYLVNIYYNNMIYYGLTINVLDSRTAKFKNRIISSSVKG
jgi:hypothetical protein